MVLKNPTNADFNRAFAKVVCGCEISDFGYMREGKQKISHEPTFSGWAPIPGFCSDANAVLPWLERDNFAIEIYYDPTCCVWNVNLIGRFTSGKSFCSGPEETLPRAIVLALLRAHGVTVEMK